MDLRALELMAKAEETPMKSDEPRVGSPIPATERRDLDLAPRAESSTQPALAVTRPTGSHLDATGATPRLASDAVSVAEAGTRSAIPEPQRVETPHLYRKPQRRELSWPLAALAYTWAAVCRRGR